MLRKLLLELLGFIPSDSKKLIGDMLGILLFVILPMLVIGGGITVLKYMENFSKPDAKCWEVQNVNGRVFKVNTCTGETDELPNLLKSNASSS